MSYTNNVIAIARETQVLVGLETTPGIQVAPSAGAMRLVLTHQAGELAQNVRLIDDPQYRNTRSRLLPITASFDVGRYQLPCLLKGQAGSGTPVAPEIDPLLQALFGLASVTDTGWFGSTPHRAYKLRGVDPGGTIYPSFTIWFKIGHTVHYAVGATCNQGEFNISGNELASAVFSGEFMRRGWCGTDRPAATGSGTSLAVVDAKKFLLGDEAAGDEIYIQFMNTSGALSPAGGVAVTAINHSTNTLTLASSQSWNETDIVVPYLPAGSEVGVPLYGKYGLVKISPFVDKTAGNLPTGSQVVNGARVTITNGIRYHADMKDDKNYPTEYVVPAHREVRGELSLFHYRNLSQYDFASQQDPLEPDYVIIPAQDRAGTQGKKIQLHIPRAIWETPNSSGEDEKVASLAFRGVATSDYNDECALVYIGG